MRLALRSVSPHRPAVRGLQFFPGRVDLAPKRPLQILRPRDAIVAIVDRGKKRPFEIAKILMAVYKTNDLHIRLTSHSMINRFFDDHGTAVDPGPRLSLPLPGEDGLQDMRLMRQIYAAAGVERL